MHGFGIKEPAYEQSLHTFSGGFMPLGHVCGLLTGAAVAAGFLARKHFSDDQTRSAAALHATNLWSRAISLVTFPTVSFLIFNKTAFIPITLACKKYYIIRYAG
jgi:hypothetical protein